MLDGRFVHYRTNIEALDQEHDILLREMATIEELNRLESDAVIEYLKDLRMRLNKHYENEERLMSLTRYPFADTHIAQHNGLRARMKHVVDTTCLHKDPKWLVHELEAILTGHVDNSDLQMAVWLLKNADPAIINTSFNKPVV